MCELRDAYSANAISITMRSARPRVMGFPRERINTASVQGRGSTTGNANERFVVVVVQPSDTQIIQPGTRSAGHGHVHLVSGPDGKRSSRLNASVVNGTGHAGEID